jgi:VWFA-related protein
VLRRAGRLLALFVFLFALAGPAGAAGGGRVVLYFDLSLGGQAGLQAAAQALSAEADDLVAVGPVEMVVADPLPSTVLPPTAQAAALRARLDALPHEFPNAGALAALRRDFADEGTAAHQDPDSYAELVNDYLDEEEQLVGNAEAGLAAWTTAAGAAVPAAAAGPRLFVLVADGFDLDPARFYLRGGGRAPVGESALHRANRGLAGQLAAGGWRVIALAVGEPAPGLGDPLAPLGELASATAGAVVRDPAQLGGALTAAALAAPPPAAMAEEAPPPPSAVGAPPSAAYPSAPAAGAASAQAAAPSSPRAPPAPSAGGPPPPILLLPPRGAAAGRTVTGKTRFQTLATDPRIVRAVFYLDGKEAATDDRAPFNATLDLGAEARPHTVRVVGYTASGGALGEHSLHLNANAGAFRVAITRLTPAASAGELEVEAQVEVPPGSQLSHLEVYRDEALVTRLDHPPFRARIAGPSAGGDTDYVRVLAVLADGHSLDDARLLSDQGAGERVEVNLVELFVVVSQKDGGVIGDLGRDDFTVKVKGETRPLQRFQLADEVPLLLGLLIDTSQSMWVLMPDTKKAASKFLADTLTEGDRAFLVDFSTEPHLAQAATGDLLQLLHGFSTLEASGSTALYDSIVFSLSQLQDAGGRRALVLLTDGQDYGSRFGPRRCIDYARELGVPVYIVSLAGLYGDGRVYRVNDLEGIVGATGGRIYYITKPEQLDQAYSQINAELRSQYVLGFGTDHPLTPDELKSIDVEVDRPGAVVRTVVGPAHPAN